MEQYPINFAALKKGDIVSALTIQRAYGKAGRDPRFAQMQLLEEIRVERTDLVAKCEADAIRILTDEEARTYTDGRFHLQRRGMVRAYELQGRVDAGELTDEQQQRHVAALGKNGMVLQAMARVMRRGVAGGEREALPALKQKA